MVQMAAEEFEELLRQRLESRWNCPSPFGLTSSEIEKIAPTPLPAIYLAFLRVCGKDAGDLFRSYNWKIEDSEERNQRLVRELAEVGLSCNAHTFSFLDYVGDNFWCFDRTVPDDPMLHRFDSWDRWVPLEMCLSKFLLEWDQYE